MTECAIHECHRKHYARNWCKSHYNRWLRTGDPLGSLVSANPLHLPGERWLPIPGWEGYYSVSDMGRVRSEPRTIHTIAGQARHVPGCVLRPGRNRSRRLTVALCRDGRTDTRHIHRLVATAFLGPRPPGLEVCHGDGDACNNRLSNLRYDTKSSNQLDSVRHGTHAKSRRTHCPRNHPLIAPNLALHELRKGGRSCLACRRAWSTVSYARQTGRPQPALQATADQHLARIMADA
jgi:hypothetical protein